MARTHSAQALQLLRATLGACRVEYLLQAMTPSSVTDSLVQHSSSELRSSFEAGTFTISDSIWRLSNIRLRLGGLGLRDPTFSASRMASLIPPTWSITRICCTGNQDCRPCLHEYRSPTLTNPTAQPLNLAVASSLTDPIHRRALHAIQESASPTDKNTPTLINHTPRDDLDA